MAARARNAARRGGLVASVGVLAVIATVLVLVLIPREADRKAKAVFDAIPPAIDTVAIVQRLNDARTRVEQTQAAIVAATRAADPTLVAPGAVTANNTSISTQDSSGNSPADGLDQDRAELARQLAHAREAPLVESYRALGATRLLRNDARVRAAIDSLEQLNREREAFAALGGADARFAALTARLSTLGQRLIRAAEAQLIALPAARPTPSPQSEIEVHTTSIADDSLRGEARRALTAARESVALAERTLLHARAQNADVQHRQDAALAMRTVNVPLVAMIAASLILGLAVGYAVAFLVELRFPKVADVSEVERITQSRVIVHSDHAQSQVTDTAARSRAPKLPRVIDDRSDAYQLLHLTLTGLGDAVRVVRVSSAEPLLAATIGINLSVAAARESRATLLIDSDLRARLGGALLNEKERPGLVEAIEDAQPAQQFITRVAIGVQRGIDVLFAGARTLKPSVDVRSSFVDELKQLTAQYDLAVVLASGEAGHESVLPTNDVILCAQLGVTPLAWLTRASGNLHASQTRMRAVFVWDASGPKQ